MADIKTPTAKDPVVKAAHAGLCPACGGGWRAGTFITRKNGQWIHRLCARGDRKLPKWARQDTPEARAYLAALARGDTFLSRRRSAWRGARQNGGER